MDNVLAFFYDWVMIHEIVVNLVIDEYLRPSN
jgi:hypothetical protein